MLEEQERMYLYNRQNGRCAICGKHVPYSQMQAAHHTADTKTNRFMYGNFFMSSPENFSLVCSLKCNDACNIGNNPGEVIKLLQKILTKEKRRYAK